MASYPGSPEVGNEDFHEMPRLSPEVEIRAPVTAAIVAVAAAAGPSSTYRKQPEARSMGPPLRGRPAPASVKRRRESQLPTVSTERPGSAPKCPTATQSARHSNTLMSSISVPGPEGHASSDSEAETLFRCHKCPAVLTEKNALARHLSFHGLSGRHTCGYCDFSSSKEEDIRRHETLHDDDSESERDPVPRKKAVPGSPPVNHPFNYRVHSYQQQKKKPSSESPKSAVPKQKQKKQRATSLPNGSRSHCSSSPEARSQSLNNEGSQNIQPVPVSAQTSVQGPTRDLQSSREGDRHIESPNTARNTSDGAGHEQPIPMAPTTAAVAPRPRRTRDHDVAPFKSEWHNFRKELPVDTTLIKSLTLCNIMGVGERRIDVSGNLIKLDGEMKTTVMIGFLLGLGYDFINLESDNSLPRTACGVTLTSENIVRRGKERASVEITLSLRYATVYENMYGSHLQLTRHITTKLPLRQSLYYIQSADEEGRFPKIPKLIGTTQVVGILDELKVASIFPLLLLDDFNLKQLRDNSAQEWYDYFDNAVVEKNRVLMKRQNYLEIGINRIRMEIEFGEMHMRFCRNRLSEVIPAGDKKFTKLRKKDINQLKELQEGDLLYSSELKKLEQINQALTVQITDLRANSLNKMNHIFQEFVKTQKYTGSIIVDEQNKRIGIWVRHENTNTPLTPTTWEEANSIWQTTVEGGKRAGTFGLFLAFWSVVEQCPFLAVDSYTGSEVDFQFPKKGLPVLMDVVNGKRGGRQQICMSLPSQPATGASC